VKFCKLLLQKFSYNKKLTTNLVQNQSLEDEEEEEEEEEEETSAPNCKTQLGRRRRRRSWSSGPAAAAADWQSANPQARISLFVFLWYLPLSLPSFLPFFLPSCVLLGPGYYYFAT